MLFPIRLRKFKVYVHVFCEPKREKLTHYVHCVFELSLYTVLIAPAVSGHGEHVTYPVTSINKLLLGTTEEVHGRR